MKARAIQALKFAGSALLAAALTGAFFAAILTLWGIAAAPYARLSSASFVIAAALAGATFLTALAWRRWHGRRPRRHGRRPQPQASRN